jgi:hypothetical protein
MWFLELLTAVWAMGGPGGRVLAGIAVESAAIGMSKTELGTCADQVAYLAFVAVYGEWPHLCVLAHQLHEPWDIRFFAQQLKHPRSRMQLSKRRPVRRALKNVLAARSRRPETPGLFQGHLRRVFGARCQLRSRNKSGQKVQDWTADSCSWSALKRAGRCLLSAEGHAREPDRMKADIARYRSLLRGVGPYMSGHSTRAWLHARGCEISDNNDALESMHPAVQQWIADVAGWHSAAYPGQGRAHLLEVLGCADARNLTLVACEAMSLVAAAAESGMGAAALLDALRSGAVPPGAVAGAVRAGSDTTGRSISAGGVWRSMRRAGAV